MTWPATWWLKNQQGELVKILKQQIYQHFSNGYHQIQLQTSLKSQGKKKSQHSEGALLFAAVVFHKEKDSLFNKDTLTSIFLRKSNTLFHVERNSKSPVFRLTYLQHKFPSDLVPNQGQLKVQSKIRCNSKRSKRTLIKHVCAVFWKGREQERRSIGPSASITWIVNKWRRWA